MKNPQKREVMLQAYRILEGFEQPTSDESYWDKLRDACEEYCSKWIDPVMHEFAFQLAAAIYDSLAQEYKISTQRTA